MTKERAKYILENTVYGEFKYAFKRSYCYNGGIQHADGITQAEDEAIRALWDTMPGTASYYSAVCRIANS